MYETVQRLRPTFFRSRQVRSSSTPVPEPVHVVILGTAPTDSMHKLYTPQRAKEVRLFGANASCKYPPMTWVDGKRVPQAELDEVVRLDELAGLEVYTSTAGVSAQFMDGSNSECGTIVVWTRHQ